MLDISGAELPGPNTILHRINILVGRISELPLFATVCCGQPVGSQYIENRQLIDPGDTHHGTELAYELQKFSIAVTNTVYKNVAALEILVLYLCARASH